MYHQVKIRKERICCPAFWGIAAPPDFTCFDIHASQPSRGPVCCSLIVYLKNIRCYLFYVSMCAQILMNYLCCVSSNISSWEKKHWQLMQHGAEMSFFPQETLLRSDYEKLKRSFWGPFWGNDHYAWLWISLGKIPMMLFSFFSSSVCVQRV